MRNQLHTQQMNIWSASSKYDCGIVLRSKGFEGYARVKNFEQGVDTPAGGKKLRMI